jgi:hypothetical protein
MGRVRATGSMVGAAVLLAGVAAAAGAGRSVPAGEGAFAVPAVASDLIAGAVAAGVVLWLYTLVAGLLDAQPVGGRAVLSERRWWSVLVLVVAGLVVVGLVVALLLLDKRQHPSLRVLPGVPTAPARLAATGADRGGPGWPALAIGAVTALLALLAARVTRRRRHGYQPARGLPGRTVPAMSGPEREQVVAALDLSLDALAGEPDPRRAVIAAYGRMDSWLAGTGWGRERWEAPFEHLDRVLVGLGAHAAVARELAGLFERAKFDVRPCGRDMKDAALAALSALRDDIVAAGRTGAGVAQPAGVGAP